MITRNKLSSQPENKLTKKFQPLGSSTTQFPEKPRKSKKKIVAILVPFLLLAVAGMTFGMMWLIMGNRDETSNQTEPQDAEPAEPITPSVPDETNGEIDEETASIQPITNAKSVNPTIVLGRLMLINPNFTVESDFIANRKSELISLNTTYGIKENKSSNGDNLMDREAAEWLNKMIADYTVAVPGHTIETRSCFREVGTNCGRMCAATGASDHHTGLTCDLIDPIYGTSLDTSEYTNHIEWQWLRQNSYKYGFIDRFPEAWAGGPMSEPANVDANGTTGLFETWHYRYVGVFAATEIATGVYNNGKYDSLEHYLKARGLVPDLLNGR